MTQDVKFNAYTPQIMEQLAKGAFLTTACDGKVNTMTIGWGSVGIFWRIPVFTVLVRYSRFTYGLLEKTKEFTVSIPFHDMSKALALCGTKSGRDVDKLAAAGLSAVPGQTVAAPVIANCGLHYECKVIYQQAMEPALLDRELNADCYAQGDYHVMYFGKILACYLDGSTQS